MAFDTIPKALEELCAGRLIVVVAGEGPGSEGDLVCAAELVTPELINFMVVEARGLVCLPMEGRRLEELGLPLMVSDPLNSSLSSLAFTISVDAKHKTSTGISAFDRAATIRSMLDPQTRPEDLMLPGHIFPLRARAGGVLVRPGRTEAAVDLARLAGLYPAAVTCEVLNEDGTVARSPELQALAARWNLTVIAVSDLVAYRHQHEKLVTRSAEAPLVTSYGEFRIIAYQSPMDVNAHLALVKGEVSSGPSVLVRIHSQCLTGDVFASARCDCGDQVAQALAAIEAEGRGVLVYMRQEGRGIGLHNKILAYALQDQGMDTVEANLHLGFPADLRHYGIGAQILVDLGLREIRLLTNNPEKVVGLEDYGLTVVEQLPILGHVNEHNARYLRTKQEKLGHLLALDS